MVIQFEIQNGLKVEEEESLQISSATVNMQLKQKEMVEDMEEEMQICALIVEGQATQ